MKQASILCFSPPGKETARRLREYLKSAYPDWNVKVFAKGRFAAESEPDAHPEELAAAETATERADVIPLTESLADWGKQHFAQDDCLIFVGSAGIAVRTIGPLAVSEKTDPAVLVVDDRLQYVIPILSGHLGGANAIACRLAAMTGAEAVLTTATDVHRKLAPDVFAQRNGLKIMDFTAAKLVAAALVRGETITIYTDAAVEGAVPDEVRLAGLEAFADYHGGGAMLISPRKPELIDKPEVLWLVPQTVYFRHRIESRKAGRSRSAGCGGLSCASGRRSGNLGRRSLHRHQTRGSGTLAVCRREAAATAVLYRGGAEPSGRKFYGIGFCQADHRDR